MAPLQRTPKNSLRCHKGIVHQETGLYKCRVCQDEFSKAMELKHHLLLVHIREKTYPCPSCGELFLDKALLDSHISMNHDNSCLDCNASFGDSDKLRRHQLTHRDEKLHACDVCHKSFGNKISLKSHQLNHSGDKHNLTAHSRLHTDETPHSPDKLNNTRITRSVRLSLGNKITSQNVPVLPSDSKTTQNVSASVKSRKRKASVSASENDQPAGKRRVLPKDVQNELIPAKRRILPKDMQDEIKSAALQRELSVTALAIQVQLKPAALQHELSITVLDFQQMDYEDLKDGTRIEAEVFSSHYLAEYSLNAHGDLNTQKGNIKNNKCIHFKNKENTVPNIKRKHIQNKIVIKSKLKKTIVTTRKLRSRPT